LIALEQKGEVPLLNTSTIPSDTMNIHVPDIDKTAAAYRVPRRLNPCLWDKSIYQDVEMGIAILLEFKNPDVRD